MSDQAPAQDAQMLTCAACGAEHPLAAMAQEEEVKPEIIQVSLICPSCGDKKHACFDTPALKAQRETVRAALAVWQGEKTRANWQRYQTARSVYQREFDSVNKRWRRKLGIGKEQKEGTDGSL